MTSNWVLSCVELKPLALTKPCSLRTNIYLEFRVFNAILFPVQPKMDARGGVGELIGVGVLEMDTTKIENKKD